MSGIPIISDWILCTLEIVLITFLTIMNMVKMRYLKKLSRFRDFKVRACFALTIITIIWNILILSNVTNFRLTVYVRIIFVIIFK